MAVMNGFTSHSVSLLDDSRHSTIATGPSLNMGAESEHVSLEPIRHMVSAVRDSEHAWKPETELIRLTLTGQWHDEPRSWAFACEESVTYPKRFRMKLTSPMFSEPILLEVLDSFEVSSTHADIGRSLPDAVHGMLLGCAVGLTEAKNYVNEAAARGEFKPGHGENNWRAPRFSFTFHTASGSPFIERWAFAIQEKAGKDKAFKAWVEQQRTGREAVLEFGADGELAGLDAIEQLPAAVHGAAIGMLIGMQYAYRRMRYGIDSGEIEKTPDGAKMKCFVSENPEEADAILTQYIEQIKAQIKQG